MQKILKNIHWFIIIVALLKIGILFKDSESKISEIQANQELEQKKLQKTRKIQKEVTNFNKDIEEAKVRIERVAIEIEKTQQLLPSEASDAENINFLRRISQEVNIKEASIVPQAEVIHGFFVSRKYKFSSKGTYLQFLIMFEKIAEYKRILNIADLNFKKSTIKQRSKFQVLEGEFNLEAYRYNAAFKEDRGIEKIEKEFKQDIGSKIKVKVPPKINKVEE